jgi:hypothetical protein
LKKGLLPFLTTGVNLEMWLKEISQTQKDWYCMIHLHMVSINFLAPSVLEITSTVIRRPYVLPVHPNSLPVSWRPITVSFSTWVQCGLCAGWRSQPQLQWDLFTKRLLCSLSDHALHHPLDTGPDVSRELSPAERSDKNLLEKMR